MKKAGIVLSGGGAKGAFELGVLQHLIPKLALNGYEIAGVAGTSIGAMIGAFLASGQLGYLTAKWKSWTNENCPLIQTPWYGPLVSLALHGSMYQAGPVYDFFKQNLDCDALRKSQIKYFNTAVRLGDGELRIGGNAENKTDHQLISEIMASMSLIPGTPSTLINGEHYGDGGFRDTVPVSALLDNSGIQYDKIFVIVVNPIQRAWNHNVTKPGPQSVIDKFLFVFWDILWDEVSRSDVQIGMLKYWDIKHFHLVAPTVINQGTTDFSSEKILESYNHGYDIGKLLLI